MPLFQKSPRANEFDLHENRASKHNWFRMETRFDRKANSISKNGLVFYHTAQIVARSLAHFYLNKRTDT